MFSPTFGLHVFPSALMHKQPYIIYVDNDPDDILLMTEAFCAIPQYNLVAFESGSQLFDYLAGVQDEHFPCLILLDINMPLLSGWDVLAALRNMSWFRSLPVVMYSTSSGGADRVQAEKFGVEIIQKPMHFDQMEEVCRKITAHCNVGMRIA